MREGDRRRAEPSSSPTVTTEYRSEGGESEIGNRGAVAARRTTAVQRKCSGGQQLTSANQRRTVAAIGEGRFRELREFREEDECEIVEEREGGDDGDGGTVDSTQEGAKEIEMARRDVLDQWPRRAATALRILLTDRERERAGATLSSLFDFGSEIELKKKREKPDGGGGELAQEGDFKSHFLETPLVT
ncbi:hypothetical protein SASPL_115727 [Salvia splendens]|uniref:Uncharacterized protein n=1 Tax=Salvia splendens TaxID=180675 RepID=A0A8X8Y5L5_SALSN|nr:hypothetical protein SASPL_115727 [Salvia splendens]